jgi:hypothetical protein
MTRGESFEASFRNFPFAGFPRFARIIELTRYRIGSQILIWLDA